MNIWLAGRRALVLRESMLSKARSLSEDQVKAIPLGVGWAKAQFSGAANSESGRRATVVILE